MSYKKFDKNDVLRNTMRAYPHSDFLIYDGKVYYNNMPAQSGSRNDQVRNVASGFISLYELNIDRPEVSTGRYIGPESEPAADEVDTRVPDNGRIYPWISKDSAGASFKTVGALSYNNEFQYGDILRSKYPLSASITREYIATPSGSTPAGAGSYNTSYVAIKNALNHHRIRSEHYAVSSNGVDGGWNKNTQELNMIHIPSIFYGTKIKPGSVRLEWYYTGSLVSVVADKKQNGELLQFSSSVHSTYDNKVAGVVLYEEGVILLTGSWDLSEDTLRVGVNPGGNRKPKWIYFGAGANDGNTRAETAASFGNASFKLSFKGVTETQVLTMFAKAKKGEVNYSNNPSFLQFGQTKLFSTGSSVYEESSDLKLVNFVSSSYTEYNAPFKRQVYISKVGIYDKNKNLIGVATLGSPVLKQDDQEIAFKLKLDI
jgi:hypothetical protein